MSTLQMINCMTNGTDQSVQLPSHLQNVDFLHIHISAHSYNYTNKQPCAQGKWPEMHVFLAGKGLSFTSSLETKEDQGLKLFGLILSYSSKLSAILPQQY